MVDPGSVEPLSILPETMENASSGNKMLELGPPPGFPPMPGAHLAFHRSQQQSYYSPQYPPQHPQSLMLPIHQQARWMNYTRFSPIDMQQRMQRQMEETSGKENDPTFFVQKLHFAPSLKMVICHNAWNKRLAAVVETYNRKEINRVKQELLEDMNDYDGRSNVPISKSSLPFLKKRLIEFLPVLHTQYPWAPYYCNLCDFYMSDIFSVVAHLTHHMWEELRIYERYLNQHCDSTKYFCPQIEVPPVREISRAHWKSHYYDELDHTICVAYYEDRMSNGRRREWAKVQKHLQSAILKKFGSRFRLDVYGSSENGFGTNASDFDVCFRYNNPYEHGNDVRTAYKQIETILKIETALRSAGFHQVMSITKTRVPIVKFVTRLESGDFIDCDISYYNELALCNTRLLRRYCAWTKNKVLSKLGIFIKRWARRCDIGDSVKGSLSSYGHMILLIHFLQRARPHPLLPILKETDYTQVIQVNGQDVYLDDDRPKTDWTKCTLSIGELFLQYLDYYSKFDWRNQVVQIRQLHVLSRNAKGWRRPMCIEAPFDHDQNLGAGISNRMFAFILKAFVMSREVYFRLDERDAFMKEIKDTERLNLRDDVRFPDGFISQYGDALLTKCKSLIGQAPRNRYFSQSSE